MERRTTRPTSKVASVDSHAGSQTGAKMLESCEACGKGATGPTNLRKHMHQEVVLSSYGGALEATCKS